MQIVHDPAGRRFSAELPSGTAIMVYAPAGEGVAPPVRPVEQQAHPVVVHDVFRVQREG